MLHRLKRTLWVLVAIAFLIEAWLWEWLQPVFQWVGRLAPWAAIRACMAALMQRLPPWAALLAFLVPFAFVEPLKLVAVWLLANGRWASAVATFVIAQVLAAGVTVLLFDLLRPQLMSINWFARAWGWLVRVHDWAKVQTEPVRRKALDALKSLRIEGGQTLARLKRQLRLLRRMVGRGR